MPEAWFSKVRVGMTTEGLKGKAREKMGKVQLVLLEKG
jgi:hypothetical protein